MKTPVTGTLAAVLLAALSPAPPAGAQEGRPDFVWDAARAEHLLNRAGFGARPEEVERFVELGQAGAVAELLDVGPVIDEPFHARMRGRESLRGRMDEMSREEAERMVREMRAADTRQLRDYLSWWVERMVAGEDPLRERMTLFWHGHFTSSMDDVKNSHEMIVQNRLLREHALGDFRALVHAIARDPAMLEYLDNDVNRRGRPNENFARELMELFTLGEGNYTEEDVKEAARAFTGWTDDRGTFRFERRLHDFGEKTVLGVTGLLDGDDVIDVLLAQKACARLVAGKLLSYFEGVEPDEERLAAYAEVLTEADYDVGAFLEHLFGDPAFYREEVLGARIASPIDFLVGSSRRLGVDPPAPMILLGASALGERLFHPPNVKGWEGGRAWVTTSSLMQRGNLVGVLLGEVTLDDFMDDDPEADDLAAETEGMDPGMDPGMDAGMEPALDDGGVARVDEDADGEERRSRRRDLGDLRRLRDFERSDWRPRVNLSAPVRRSGAASDREIVRELTGRLLAVDVDPETREGIVRILEAERAERSIAEGELFDHPWDAEELLRELAHVILSLPEAQLH
jgi:hypothetical protein